MPLYQEEIVEKEEKLKVAQVFFCGDKVHVRAKSDSRVEKNLRAGHRRPIKSLARAKC